MEKDLKGLKTALSQAGMKHIEAETIVNKISKNAREKGVSILREIFDTASSKADLESVEFKLHLAINSIGGVMAIATRFPSLTSPA